VRRLPDKQVSDRARLDALLDAAFVAHVAVLDDAGQPYVVPLAVARDGDRLLVHGSTASRAFTYLAGGAATCATVTVVDGVVVARSQFESSLHYRSAMILGSFEVLEGQAKRRALDVLAAALLPELDGARTPSDKELAATTMLAMPITEWSLKVSDGPPEDAADDVDRPSWAGVVPLHHRFGAPVDAPDLVAGVAVPAAIADWPPGRA
jgi:nitroimidazol reductase NimA-like FMN-containing flavoprotein (pyridoxamine 5'-phosphate oxidase superfamily)